MFDDDARDLAAVKGARARLHLLVWRHLRSVRDYPLLCRLMFREVRGESDYHGSGLHAMNRQYTQFLVVVIEEGRASGDRALRLGRTGPRQDAVDSPHGRERSEEHTSELQSLMRISYAVFCLKKKTQIQQTKV